MGSPVYLKNLISGRHGLNLIVPATGAAADICLPLYQCDSQPLTEVEQSAATKLQYARVALQLEGEDGLNSITEQLRDGWLYVFVNGYLWHEYQVDADSGQFRDVDLRYCQKQDSRAACGDLTCNIVFPLMLDGEETRVQIAFSEVQWSWSRICSLGGMNPEDPRLTHVVRNGEVLSQIAAQYPFIESWQKMADDNGLDDASEIQAGQVLMLRDADEPIGDTECSRTSRMGLPLSEQSALGGDYSIVYVQDPLGQVEAFNTGMTMLLMNQQQILGEMQGSFIAAGQCESNPNLPVSAPYLLSTDRLYTPPPLPVVQDSWQRKDICSLTSIAQLSYATYLDDDAIDNVTVDDNSLSESERQEQKEKIQESLRSTAERLHKDDILNWLRVKERAELRAEYRTIQKAYIDLIVGDLDAYESFDFSIGVFAALEDYAWLSVDDYHRLWARFADIENHLVIDPNTFDHQYDIKADTDRERSEFDATLNKGKEIVESIHAGDHDASDWLFPKENDVDIRSDQPPTAGESSDITGPQFRLADFQKAVATYLDKPEEIHGEKNTIDFLNRFSKVLLALTNEYSQRPRVQTCIQMLFRLIKGAGLPELEGLHLVSKGEVLDGKLPLGKYRIERVGSVSTEAQHRNQRKLLSIESSLNRKQDDWYSRITQVIDSQGNTVASTDIAYLKPWQGINPANAEQPNHVSIFEEHGKTGNGEVIVKASIDAWVVPHNTKVDGIYRRASEISGTQLYSQAAVHLPKIMLLVEAIALKEAIQKLNTSSRLESSVQLIGQSTNVLGAIVDVLDAWYGSKDEFIRLIDRRQSIRFMAKPLRLPGTSLKVPVIRWLGPVGNVIGAGFAALDSYRLFKNHDYDAAMLMSVAAALGFTGAVLGLAGGAMAGTIGTTASLMIPIIGWAIFAISIAIIFAVERWFRDSPSEHWAEHSPFGADRGIRLDHDRINSVPAALVHLKNLIMQPSATVLKELNNGVHRVKVTINHPGFILDQSTLEYEAEVYTSSTVITQGAFPSTMNGKDKKTITPVCIEDEGHGAHKRSTMLTFEFPEVPDTTSIYHSMIKETAWELRYRHVLPDGVSLPLNDSAYDQDDDTDIGWSQLTWTTT